LYRRKKVATPKVPLKARSSPAIVPLTPGVPIRQNTPSTSAPRAKKMAEASAKDAMPNTTFAGGSEKVVPGRTTSKKGEMAAKAGYTSKWKK
jgi:alpha-beta hydrolase superfamily lysophospholipase